MPASMLIPNEKKNFDNGKNSFLAMVKKAIKQKRKPTHLNILPPSGRENHWRPRINRCVLVKEKSNSVFCGRNVTLK
jgi:hypothetical protein